MKIIIIKGYIMLDAIKLNRFIYKNVYSRIMSNCYYIGLFGWFDRHAM